MSANDPKQTSEACLQVIMTGADGRVRTVTGDAIPEAFVA
jgi:hypothetical protein